MNNPDKIEYQDIVDSNKEITNRLIPFQNLDYRINKYDTLLEQLLSLINNKNVNEATLLDMKKTIVSLKQEETLNASLTNIYPQSSNYNLGDIINHNLNQFNNLSPLDHGGFGVVIRGDHRLDGQTYAIKLIPIKIKINSNLKLYLLSKIREIRYLSSLTHTNIVRYHNSWLQFYQVDKLTKMINENN